MKLVPVAYLASYLLSLLGNSIAGIALPLIVLQRSHEERAGPIAITISGERGTPEVRKLARILERQRLRGAQLVMRLIQDRFAALKPELTVESAAETVWVATAPENWDRLVAERGWTADQYEQWLGSYFILMLLA